MPIWLTTLGGLHVARDDVAQDGLLTQRQRAALLVYLAVERRVPREVLVTVFWPESSQANARHALRQCIYQLRKSLGGEWIETRAHEERVTEDLHVDVQAFEAALARDDAEAAARLYGGPFLRGVHLLDLQPWEAWVESRRTHYARLFRKASRDWLSQREGAGDAAGAIEAAQRWAAPDPLDDEAQHRLIKALADAGERAEAIRQYEAYARLLEPDGLKPLDETVALAASLQRSDTRLPPPPAGQGRSAHPEVVPGGAAEAHEESTRPTLSTSARPARSAPSRRSRRRSAALVAAALLLTVLAFLVWVWPEQPSASGARPLARVAVLPFQDDTGNAGFGWLADGLTTGLTDALRRVAVLEVTPTSGVRPYQDGTTPLPAVASALNVDWLVGGRVTRRGTTIVARAELIDSAGRLIDSREVAGASDAALRLVGDVVEEVSTFLRMRIGAEVRIRTWSAGTRSEQAFRLVHGAARDVATADELTEAGHLESARQLLERADSSLVQAAPEDDRWSEPHLQRASLAYKLAIVAARQGRQPEAIRTALERGVRHAEEALRLSPGDAAALEMRGVLRRTAWVLARPADDDAAAGLLAAAESDLRAAVVADSTRARALSVLSSIHFARDEFALARTTAERAYAADAYLDEAREILARLFFIAFESADDSAAQTWCAEMRRRFPDFWFGTSCRLALVAWSPVAAPDAEEAWTLTRLAVEAAPEQQRATVRAQLEMQAAGVLARMGLRDSASRVIERARDTAYAQPAFTRSPTDRAELLLFEADVRVLLGQHDAASALLEEYFAQRPEVRRRFLASRRFSGLADPAPLETTGRSAR